MPSALRVRGLEPIIRDLRQFNFALPRAQKTFLDMVGNHTLSILRANTPVDTGELRNSWVITSRGVDKIEIGMKDSLNFNKLNIIRFGAPAHVIDAAGGGPSETMLFRRGGLEIFTARVFHPGVRRNDFVSAVTRNINDFVVASLDAAFVLHSGLYKKARKSGAISSTGTFRQNKNLTRTVGLGKFSAARRGFGRSTLTRTRTGKISNRRRLSRRRRRGGSINSIKARARLK